MTAFKEEIAQELSKTYKILKNSEDKSNQEIAEALGLNLNDFDFDELITLEEYEIAQTQYPEEWAEWQETNQDS